MPYVSDFEELDIIIPNLKVRLSGVTSTIIQITPALEKAGVNIATIGFGLPDHLPKLRIRDIWRLWKKNKSGEPRIWHARRNNEMIAGLILVNMLRMPLKLIFTSAAQRHHTWLTKWLIKEMDYVIATSQKSGSYLRVPYTIIPHGIDIEHFQIPINKKVSKSDISRSTDRKLVGCTGRIRPSKGTDIFVDAMIQILPDLDNWDAVITGRTTRQFKRYQDSLVEKIRRAGLSDRIIFTGEVKNIRLFYQAFDLFVAPSRNEGFGLTPLEAMACGVRAVTSRAGSYPELLADMQYDLTFNVSNRAAAVKQIRKAMELTPTLKSDEIRRHVVRKYNLKKEVVELKRLYAEVLT